MNQRTSLEQFAELYFTRLGNGTRFVDVSDLAASATVDVLRRWPIQTLRETAPTQFRRCRRPLTHQLQAWVRQLQTQAAVRLTEGSRDHQPRVPRHGHSLTYWNASGPNGGLRRWH